MNFLPPDEEFYIYHELFLDALYLLAESAETLCERMGNFNVAWELKRDLESAGARLVSSSGGNLSELQQSAIQTFLSQLALVPDSILRATSSRGENIIAMSHDSWSPVRRDAIEIVGLLKHA